MAISLFDMFKIGIGPSSSHTVGPMEAAHRFACGLREADLLEQVRRIDVQLYGSLGATGKGHGTGPAVLLGLEGHQPDTIDPEALPARTAEILAEGELLLDGSHAIGFDYAADLTYHRRETLPYHPNGMMFTAFAGDEVLRQRTYYSVGGGFVVDESAAGADRIVEDTTPLAYPFRSAADLLEQCR